MKLDFTPIIMLNSVSENEIWKIKARVTRIWRFHNTEKPGDVGGLDLILVDEKGDRIQACIRGKLISKFQNEFEEGACRILMNFKLSPNLGNYRPTAHSYKIFFTWSTHVKPCEEIPNLSLRFNFISFDEILTQKRDDTVFVDVIGEIIGMNEIKEITVRNAPCKLLNLQLKSLNDTIIDCVFWEKYAEDIYSYVSSFSSGPIVMICSLMRINIYERKITIQSAKSSTKLFINSDTAEINEFKERMSNISTSSGGLLLTLPSSTQLTSDNFSLDSQKTISQLLASYEGMTCSIYATICALKTEISWFYIGCPTCLKKVSPYLNPETEEIEADKFTCDSCQKTISSTVTRYQVHVKAMDDTGTTSFLIFDKEVIQLIHKSAYELLEQQVQFNRGSAFPPDLLALQGRSFIFNVLRPSTSKSYTPTTFKVVKITDDPAKILAFRCDDENMADTHALDPQFSNSTPISNSLIDDVSFETSSSVCASTELPSTPSKKQLKTYVRISPANEDGVAQVSSKKQKTEFPTLKDKDADQHCASSAVVNDEDATKDDDLPFNTPNIKVICSSTDLPATPRKQQVVTSQETSVTVVDENAHVSPNKKIPEVITINEEAGELSATKPKRNLELAKKVNHLQKMLIPKKEKP